MSLKLKFVNDRWNSVDSFLRYVIEHSKTPRALFHRSQVAEMCHLHGEDGDGDDIEVEWQSVDFTDWVNDITNLKWALSKVRNETPPKDGVKISEATKLHQEYWAKVSDRIYKNCTKCDGVGLIISELSYEDCSDCEGTGLIRFNNKQTNK